MSVIGATADDICSQRVFRLLTHLGSRRPPNIFHPTATRRLLDVEFRLLECGAKPGYPDETIFRSRRSSPETKIRSNGPDQKTGFDHLGHHHQLNLPPVLPELCGRCAKAAGVGLKSSGDRCAVHGWLPTSSLRVWPRSHERHGDYANMSNGHS
jgi:hypothetical protein